MINRNPSDDEHTLLQKLFSLSNKANQRIGVFGRNYAKLYRDLLLQYMGDIIEPVDMKDYDTEFILLDLKTQFMKYLAGFRQCSEAIRTAPECQQASEAWQQFADNGRILLKILKFIHVYPGEKTRLGKQAKEEQILDFYNEKYNIFSKLVNGTCAHHTDRIDKAQPN
jgi:hypothetical protein